MTTSPPLEDEGWQVIALPKRGVRRTALVSGCAHGNRIRRSGRIFRACRCAEERVPPRRKALSADDYDQRLAAALAAEFPTALCRTVRPRLLAATVFVIGSARRVGHLAVEGFAELALGLVLGPLRPRRLTIFRGVRFSHTGSLAWTGRAWLVDMAVSACLGACRTGARLAASAAPADR